MVIVGIVFRSAIIIVVIDRAIIFSRWRLDFPMVGPPGIPPRGAWHHYPRQDFHHQQYYQRFPYSATSQRFVEWEGLLLINIDAVKSSKNYENCCHEWWFWWGWRWFGRLSHSLAVMQLKCLLLAACRLLAWGSEKSFGGVGQQILLTLAHHRPLDRSKKRSSLQVVRGLSPWKKLKRCPCWGSPLLGGFTGSYIFSTLYIMLTWNT